MPKEEEDDRSDEEGIENQKQYESSLKYFQTLETSEQDRLVKNLVRLAVYTENKRIPLTRDEITKKVLLDKSKAFLVVFQRAQARLKDIFGMELVQIVSREKKKQAQTKFSKSYVLRSVLRSKERAEFIEWNKGETEKMNLLVIILCLIYGHGKSMAHNIDGTLEVFGKMTDLMGYYVKHLYLDKFKETGDEEFNYTWGPRSKALFPERSVTRLMAQVINSHLDVS
ncbi:Melanoma-associated antigen F1 [Terramyces sp. JEL0728]|nr:Melanoma-associated antigen F1 [Terramyces sp. JEL0728]